MKINWKSNKKTLDFTDLKVNESFRIVSPYSKGAVYTKVDIGAFGLDSIKKTYGIFGQLEIMTGKVFPPTTSEVELVEVNAVIEQDMPNLYKS